MRRHLKVNLPCRVTSQCHIVPSCLVQSLKGTTHVTGFLEGEDALATLQAFRDMGVSIEGPKNGEVIIHWCGYSWV